MSNDKKNKSDNKTIFLLILGCWCVLFGEKEEFMRHYVEKKVPAKTERVLDKKIKNNGTKR